MPPVSNNNPTLNATADTATNPVTALLGQALEEYEMALSQTPARIVFHKLSKIRQSELDGFHFSLPSIYDKESSRNGNELRTDLYH
ncbi:MAG: hypothetical protein NXH95_08015 [Pseudomonadaceae bacterium]|nr:hypothetical protein [Pseudomonadaceae bacterium]